MSEEEEVEKYKRLYEEQKAKVKELERQNSQLKVGGVFPPGFDGVVLRRPQVFCFCARDRPKGTRRGIVGCYGRG